MWRTLSLRFKMLRFGALFWIAVLLTSSALFRIGFEISPALARDSEISSQMEESEAMPVQSPAKAESNLAPLLLELKRREDILMKREMQFEDRMKALEVANSALDEKLTALKAMEEELATTLAEADGANARDIERLTEMYNNMKPKEAAGLFETMDPTFAAGFLSRMRPDAAAGIMAKISPEIAYSISAILAGRNNNVPRN